MMGGDLSSLSGLWNNFWWLVAYRWHGGLLSVAQTGLSFWRWSLRAKPAVSPISKSVWPQDSQTMARQRVTRRACTAVVVCRMAEFEACAT